MDEQAILQYYQNYEREVKYQQSSIDVNGYDYAKDILRSPDNLDRDLLQRKVNKLIDKINSKKKYIERKDGYKKDKEIKDIIQQVVCQREYELLNKAILFKKENIEREISMEAQKLANDNSCQICYPVLEKGKYRHPLFVFDAVLQHGGISIKKIHANINALILYIAYFTEMNKNEVEQVYAKEIQYILQEIENLNAPETMDEGLESVTTVVNEKFSHLFSSVTEFTEYDGWSRLSTVFVTTETLNEFREPPFRNEIAMVQKRLKKNSDQGKFPLSSYLIGKNKQISFDQMKDKSYFHFGSYTDAYPINKKQWHILGGLDNTQLLSVNGPPGTGKTTLLKEIIADTLVKKAQQLVSIWNEKWEFNEKGKVYISPMKGENDYSILVTSTNNKAVDNIGEELLAEVDYFSQFITDTDDSDKTIAGLVCARLGKKDNVDKFRENVMDSLIKGLETNHSQMYEETEKQTLAKFNEMIADLENTQQAIDNYLRKSDECSMQGLLDSNHDQTKPLEQLESVIEELFLLIQQLEVQDKELNQKKAACTYDQQAGQEDQAALQNELLRMENEIKEYYKVLEVYRSYNKTKWLAFLPKRRKFLAEYPSEQFILDRINQKDQQYSNKQKQIEEKKQEQLKREHEIESLNDSLERLNENLKEKRKQSNEQQVDIDLLRQREQAIEKLTSLLRLNSIRGVNNGAYELIHCNEVVTQKRHLLFKQALHIREHYIWKHRKAILFNLKKISGTNYLFQPYYSETQEFSPNRENAVRTAWETFFLCFPVVTTTLHSFKSPSFHMIESYIDLLLVDESGQVLPHYLAGPLHRVKRALIVGDVMQIAPVRPLANNIIEQTDIPEKDWDIYDIDKNSVQHYADRHSDIFEMMGTKKLGIILEEHRRCEPAIAAFSNHYVYNDRLDIVKTDDEDKLFGDNLIGIDVRGNQTSSNINKQEASICKRIIHGMIDRYGEAVKKDIGIITPFRNQKKYLEKLIKDVEVGTVHTFQGQEKKYILFSAVVNEKLTDFVGGRPNLLNVAVTRGKEQFIFLGNFAAASQSQNYLSGLIHTIRNHGTAFSIFNTSLQDSDSKHAAEVFQLFATQEIIGSSEFGKLLREYFPKNVIIGARYHLSTLLHALAKAEESVEVISPWVDPGLIMNRLNDRIIYALKRGTDIRVVFGYKKNKQATLDDIESIYEVDGNKLFIEKDEYVKVVSMLQDMLKDGLEYKPPLHVKLLLVDKAYLIIGSHNWLSNKTTQHNVKEEISAIITDKETIAHVVKYFGLQKQEIVKQ